jgi:hypothetical protein
MMGQLKDTPDTRATRTPAAGNPPGFFFCRDVPRTDRKFSTFEQFRSAAGGVCSHEQKEQPVGCPCARRWP